MRLVFRNIAALASVLGPQGSYEGGFWLLFLRVLFLRGFLAMLTLLTTLIVYGADADFTLRFCLLESCPLEILDLDLSWFLQLVPSFSWPSLLAIRVFNFGSFAWPLSALFRWLGWLEIFPWSVNVLRW